MRYLAVLLVAAAMQGCVSLPEDDLKWNGCVQRGLFAGDKFRNVENSLIGTIIEVYGPSYRCRDPRHPNLAAVRYGE